MEVPFWGCVRKMVEKRQEKENKYRKKPIHNELDSKLYTEYLVCVDVG